VAPGSGLEINKGKVKGIIIIIITRRRRRRKEEEESNFISFNLY